MTVSPVLDSAGRPFGKELVDLAGCAKLARDAAACTLDAFLDGTQVGGAPLRSHRGGWRVP